MSIANEWLFLGLAVVLVFANAFFVAVEFALVKVRVTQLEALVEQRVTGASVALGMRNNLNRWLSACQVGITLASLALGWVGEPAFAGILMPLFGDAAWAHSVAVASAFAIITFLHIVIGEQVPKTLAIQYADVAALKLAWPMRIFAALFYPVIGVLNLGTQFVMRSLGLSAKAEGQFEALSESELKLIFESSAQAGVIDSSRADLLQRALSMVEKTAKQVLVPRNQMKVVNLELSLDENINMCRQSGHTWLPVVRGTNDQVEGVLNVKDLYYLLIRGELRSLSQVQRPVLFVPENVTLEQLLSEFKKRKKHLAIAVDEHGGTTGLVTLADVVSELVGDIATIGRKIEPVRALPGGKLELPGTAPLGELEHTLEVEFDVDKTDITTIAGYLMAKLGRVPRITDVWSIDDYLIRVTSVEGPRVVTVRVEPRIAVPVPRMTPSAQ